jgi:hypothetical protein
MAAALICGLTLDFCHSEEPKNLLSGPQTPQADQDYASFPASLETKTQRHLNLPRIPNRLVRHP